MRFTTSSGWHDEERVGGAGSVFPFFVADEAASQPSLVFREGVQGRWDLFEIGGAGEVRSHTRWNGEAGSRPVIRRSAAGAGRLEWLGGASERSSTP
jgi:hypothetical protein